MGTHASPPPTTLEPASETLLSTLKDAPLTVLCGRNNAGKSFILRRLLRAIGEKAFYLGPARYHNFNTLNVYGPSAERRSRRWHQMVTHLFSDNQNVDNSPMNLGEAISAFSDAQREKLFALLERLLGSSVSVEQTVSNNLMSQRYIRVDDYNLAFQSSGFRLAATLLTCLFDSDYDTFIVDEPELGLSPEVQGTIADFLFDPSNRAEYFPHIKTVILATHSPLFIDRRDISSNVAVARSGTKISLTQISTIQDFHRLQLQLLGNRLETLYLPAAIILVEGPCDHTYVARLVALNFPSSPISVIACAGDSRIKEVLALARQMLADFTRSPYANRIFVVLDSVHEKSMPAQLVKMGLAAENIVVWEKNGIEHLYPVSTMQRRFGVFASIDITGDEVSANGVTVKKRELAEFIVANMTGGEALPEELKQKLISPLRALATV